MRLGVESKMRFYVNEKMLYVTKLNIVVIILFKFFISTSTFGRKKVGKSQHLILFRKVNESSSTSASSFAKNQQIFHECEKSDLAHLTSLQPLPPTRFPSSPLSLG
jgi:hypothetical protein